ncbi:MAG: DUF5018 domain-containing protein, partial [Bacteroidota bacterium]
LCLSAWISCNEDDDVQLGNDAKQILSFAFLASQNDALEEDVRATIDKKKKTVTVLVPNGTSITALEPTIKISNSATISPKSKVAMDFGKEVTYTVKAENGSTQKYKAVVKVAKSSDKSITAFEFKAKNNDDLDTDIIADIDQDKKVITATVLARTEIVKLAPSITISKNAKLSPDPETAFDFSSEVEYTVTAEDGSKQKYIVRLNIAQSTDKEITSFAFLAADNDGLDIDFPAVIDKDSRRIHVELPFGTSVKSLVPTITFSENATLEPNNKVAKDFSESVRYVITAEDGTQAVYIVSVGFPPSPDRAALIAIYNANPGNELFWDFDEPDLSKWAGVSIDDNSGRVVILQLNAARKLTSIPKEIGELSELEELNLSNNQLKTLPDQMGKLSKLKRFIITDNELEQLPASLSQLDQLETLGLARNKLTSFPESVLGMESLKVLGIAENKIQSLPSQIEDLSELEGLSLTGTQLKTVPMELGKLSKLTSLFLNNNQLTTIPKELGNLTLLRQFSIQDNNIISIPKEICDLNIPDFQKDDQATCVN